MLAVPGPTSARTARRATGCSAGRATLLKGRHDASGIDKRRVVRAKRPKLHLVDAALLAPLLGLDVAGTLRSGRHGQIVETFVASQLRVLTRAAAASTRLYHLRQPDGHEVDILLERPDHTLVAIEVKAARAPP
jgi:predicted AAA+ superfamily ATPase